MVGIRSFPFGMAYFQGRAVSFRGCIPLRKNWRRLFFRMLGLGPGTLHRGHVRPIRPTSRIMAIDVFLIQVFSKYIWVFFSKNWEKELFILSTLPSPKKKKITEKTNNQGYWLTTCDWPPITPPIIQKGAIMGPLVSKMFWYWSFQTLSLGWFCLEVEVGKSPPSYIGIIS